MSLSITHIRDLHTRFLHRNLSPGRNSQDLHLGKLREIVRLHKLELQLQAL